MREFMSMRFILLTCFMKAYLHAKQVTFTAINIVRKPIGPGTTLDDFQTWLMRADTVETILRSNPGLEKVDRIDDQRFMGRVSPIEFPGLTVRTSVEFDCVSDDNRLEVTCRDGAVTQEFEGNKLFASRVSKLLPKVTSSTIFEVDSEAHFVNRASLEIAFALPSWFPIPAEVIEKRGSASIQQSMLKDMTSVVDKVLDVYQSQSKAMAMLADKEY